MTDERRRRFLFIGYLSAGLTLGILSGVLFGLVDAVQKKRNPLSPEDV